MSEGVHEDVVIHKNENSSDVKKNSGEIKSADSSPGDRDVNEQAPIDVVVDTSIEHLYDNVCDMQSSDQSPSRASFGSYGEESIIDSELRHLVGGARREVEIMEEEEREEEEKMRINGFHSESPSKKESSSSGKKSGNMEKSQSSLRLKKASESDDMGNSNRKSNVSISNEKNDKTSRKSNAGGSSGKKIRDSPLGGGVKTQNGTEVSPEKDVENPDLGPFLLKQARDLLSSGDSSQKALELARRASKSFEKCSNGKTKLDLVMSLHVTAAIYCNLGKYSEAIPVLERSIEFLSVEENQEHALAKFSGYMQLGDTYALVGQLDKSISSYTSGLEIQRKSLGGNDVRVGETCRYLAEAHVQSLQFEDAAKYCQMALDIHRENGSPASLEEAADRRLMGLICETKGDYEGALEHLVLAGMSMVANGQEAEVAFVDCSIGDMYLSLNRYDEAVFAYQKALTVFKSSKGENHPTVGSVFVRLADLYNRTGKSRESKSYCENALRIFTKPLLGFPQEEIASGLTNVAAIYESMNELQQAIKLLQKALKIYNDYPGQQNTIAGIEAQMGVIYYMLGNYSESYSSLSNAISKLRASGEKKSAFFGIALNQMGLACVQRYDINEAAKLFEEARVILEQECGPYHSDTLGVYSNLAGTYDALGRLDEAIEVLEHVVGMREEKLGTANPDVDDEKKRLAVLLKEAGKVRTRKARSLETLFDVNLNSTQSNSTIKV